MRQILIIDDDPKYRNILKAKITHEGYECVEAVNGQDALRFMEKQSESVGLILLDLVLPDMDGLTCYYKMKQMYGISTPIIILTNSSIAAYPSDIKEYVVKTDTTLDGLIAKIKKHLP